MNELQIETEEGYEIDLEKSDLSKNLIIFKEVEKSYPTCWEDLHIVSGYFISSSSSVKAAIEPTYHTNKNIFPTEEEAQAVSAIAQLKQLLKAYNGDWQPNWLNDLEQKFVITTTNIDITTAWRNRYTLAFRTKDQAEHFKKHHIDLISQARPLLLK